LDPNDFTSASLQQAHYNHYYFNSNPEENESLNIHLYVDQSNNQIENLETTLYVNFNNMAGSGDSSSCWDSFESCTISSIGSCTVQLNPCILS
jgi:mevalonate pyrophosphate decarboxylase